MTAEAPDRPAPETLRALVEGDDDGQLTFDAPWQARAFGMAVALRDRDAVDWDDFQSRFVERVGSVDPDRMRGDVESVYYECWLEALEGLLTDEGLVEAASVDRRTEAFATGDRDASEFVVDRP